MYQWPIHLKQNIMNTKQTIRALHKDIDEAIDKVLKKHGQRKLSSNIRYTTNSMTLNLKSVIQAPDTESTDNTVLKCGYAEPGTIAYIVYKGSKEKVRILSAARKKYQFEFVDSPELNNDGTWRGHFDQFESE